MTANASNSYFNYLHRLVDCYNNTYHCFIAKNFVDPGYSALPKKLNQMIRFLNLVLVKE